MHTHASYNPCILFAEHYALQAELQGEHPLSWSTSPLTGQLSSQQDDSYILRQDVRAPARCLISTAVKHTVVGEEKENKSRVFMLQPTV